MKILQTVPSLADTTRVIQDSTRALASPNDSGSFWDWVEGMLQSFSDATRSLIIEILGGIIGAIFATIILSFLGWLLWKKLRPNFWKIVARIGTFKGLRTLAIRAYLQSIRERYGQVTNIYLDRKETLDLHRVFVPLSLRTRERDEKAISSPRSTREVFTNPDQRRLVILGAPGSGKTTLLQALASGASRHQWVEYNDLVPILIFLRSYARQSTTVDLHNWLTGTVLPEHGMRNAQSLLKSLLSEGKILLLLDGLDEASEENQANVIEQIIKFLDNWDKNNRCRVIITCREQNFDLLPDSSLFRHLNFREYRFSNMRDSEVEAMIQSRLTDFIEPQKSPEEFLKAIYAKPNITELHRNPLLLTLSIGLYLYRVEEKVPHDLAAFYQESIDHLLKL